MTLTIIQSMIAYPLNSVWYLQASMIAAILLIPFLRKNKINVALCFGGVLYLWGLLCNNYRFLVEGTFVDVLIQRYLELFLTARNGIFYGFVFIVLGIKCAEYVNSGRPLNTTKLGILTVVFFLLSLGEMLFVRIYTNVDDLFISTLIFIPMLFLFLASINFSEDNKIVEKRALTARNLSVGLYLLHRPILCFLA